MKLGQAGNKNQASCLFFFLYATLHEKKPRIGLQKVSKANQKPSLNVKYKFIFSQSHRAPTHMLKTCLCNSTNAKMSLLVTLGVETHEKCGRKRDGSCVATDVCHEPGTSPQQQCYHIMWLTVFTISLHVNRDPESGPGL